jgi:hypothetical protein
MAVYGCVRAVVAVIVAVTVSVGDTALPAKTCHRRVGPGMMYQSPQALNYRPTGLQRSVDLAEGVFHTALDLGLLEVMPRAYGEVWSETSPRLHRAPRAPSKRLSS